MLYGTSLKIWSRDLLCVIWTNCSTQFMLITWHEYVTFIKYLFYILNKLNTMILLHQHPILIFRRRIFSLCSKIICIPMWGKFVDCSHLSAYANALRDVTTPSYRRTHMILQHKSNILDASPQKKSGRFSLMISDFFLELVYM